MDAAGHYDVIVVGVGGMGSATCHALARRGRRVLGLERYDIPHELGSSHGLTRIIRLAYSEHPSYVPLLRRSLELWREIEARAGEQLLYVTGTVDAGPADSATYAGAKLSSDLHNLPHEDLSGAELAARFPGYHLPADYRAIFQPEGGFLNPERCIVAYVGAAQALGADIHAREQVLEWTPTVDGVRVRTDRGAYTAERLVLSAGPWAAALLPRLRGLAAPERLVVGWFQPRRPEVFSRDRFPVFNMDVPEGRFYGFPVYSIPGFKIGRWHHLGEQIDPDTMDRGLYPRDEAVLRECVARYFPDALGPTMMLKSCIVTNTPDENFIVDVLPDLPQVSVAAGFSGHGFKFCSVIGEIMADLAVRGATDHDIGLFRLDRFAAAAPPA